MVGSLFFHHVAANNLQLIPTAIPYETANYFGVKIDVINNIFVLTNLVNAICIIPVFIITDYYGPTVAFYGSLIFGILSQILRATSFIVEDKNAGFLFFVASQFIVILQLQGSSVISLPMISMWFPLELRTAANSMSHSYGSSNP